MTILVIPFFCKVCSGVILPTPEHAHVPLRCLGCVLVCLGGGVFDPEAHSGYIIGNQMKTAQSQRA